jgi:hypothetical protein
MSVVVPDGQQRARQGVIRRRAVTAGLVAAAVITLTAWLYASPPGSSPDDGYHLGSIWCAAGFQPDRCLEAIGVGDPDFALAPAVLSELPCVGGDGRQPATCVNGVYERLEGQFRPIPANITGSRASLYYRVANLLVSDDHAAAIARIRVMNAAVVLLMISLTAALAAPDVRRALLGTWLVASLPLGLFLATSLNSTAWGLAGLGTLWANGLTTLRPGSWWRRGLAGGLAVIGAGMALGSRTEAAAHLAVILIALIALASTDVRQGPGWLRWSRRRALRSAIAATVGIVAITFAARFAAFSYLLSATSGLERGWERLVARGISNPILTLAAETPQLWTGALGTWSLGWLDTNLPSSVSVATTVSFATLVAFGLAGASRGRSAGAVVVLAGLLILPVVSLLASGLIVLEQLQPRHYLPLLYVLLGLALVRSPGQSALHLGRGARIAIASALSVGHSVALTININRYTRGLTEFLYIDTNREVEWWWGGLAPSPGSVWLIGSLGFALGAFLVIGQFNEPGSTGRDGGPSSATRPTVRA